MYKCMVNIELMFTLQLLPFDRSSICPRICYFFGHTLSKIPQRPSFINLATAVTCDPSPQFKATLGLGRSLINLFMYLPTFCIAYQIRCIETPKLCA